MRVAITTANGRIAPVFDVCQHVDVVTLAAGKVQSREHHALPSGSGVERIAAVARLSVDALVCGAISRQLAGVAAAYGLELMPFTSGSVEDILASLATGVPLAPDYLMPGCGRGGRRRRWRGGGRGRGGGQGRQRGPSQW